MNKLAVILLVALLPHAFAQGSVEERLAALEARVAELSALLAVPVPPTTAVEVDGFSFTRLAVRNSPIGLELVGEVASETTTGDVTFRVTYYEADGSILETDTFSVEVGPTPRTFDAGMFSEVSAADVHSYALQVERIR